MLQYIFLALIPVVILLIGLLVVDHYDREPMKLLLKLFIYGFLVALPIILIEKLLQQFNFFIGFFAIAFEAFIVAGLTEEFFKRKVVLKVAFKHVAFNEKLDGIIYCAFAALGFAAIENILYLVFQSQSVTNIALMRGLLSVPAHMLFAITMGYYISMAKYATTPALKKSYMRKSLIHPIILHGLFNFILMINISFLFIFIPYVVILWVINIKKIRAFYRLSKQAHKNLQ